MDLERQVGYGNHFTWGCDDGLAEVAHVVRPIGVDVRSRVAKQELGNAVCAAMVAAVDHRHGEGHGAQDRHDVLTHPRLLGGVVLVDQV
ncbi:hypothetical protein D3C85_1733690 [compost metagenome]